MTKYAIVALILMCGVAPAFGGLWSLLSTNSMWGGRSLANPQKVHICPRERPYLFGGVVAVHMAALFASSAIVYLLLSN
jgi:hypothetical protein